MKYLVTMEAVGSPAVASAEEIVPWLERMVIPSQEAVIALQREGKILAGGDLAGRKGWAAVVEAASNE